MRPAGRESRAIRPPAAALNWDRLLLLLLHLSRTTHHAAARAAPQSPPACLSRTGADGTARHGTARTEARGERGVDLGTTGAGRPACGDPPPPWPLPSVRPSGPAPRVTLGCLYPTSPPPTHQFPAGHGRPGGTTNTTNTSPARRFAFAFTSAPVFRPGWPASCTRLRSPYLAAAPDSAAFAQVATVAASHGSCTWIRLSSLNRAINSKFVPLHTHSLRLRRRIQEKSSGLEASQISDAPPGTHRIVVANEDSPSPSPSPRRSR